MSTPLLRDWTAEKAASIDWANGEEVLQHCCSLLHILTPHPRLNAWFEAQPVEKRRALMKLFLENGQPAKENKLRQLGEWLKAGYMDLRQARWCRGCGREGHTMRSCPKDGKEETTPTMAQYQRHLDELERRKLLESMKPAAKPIQTQRRTATISDEFYRGTVKSIDLQWGKGEINVAALGPIPFTVERCDFGLKRIRVGDEVRLHLENYDDRRMAVDVSPISRELTLEDIQFFTQQCNECKDPIRQICSTLALKSDWRQLIQQVHQHDHIVESTVHAVIRMTTFLPNRVPIHQHLLRAFLRLLLTPADGGIAFFPDLVTRVCPKQETALLQLEKQPTFADNVLELCDFVQLIRCQTNVRSSVMKDVVKEIRPALSLCLAAPGVPTPQKKKLLAAFEYLNVAENEGTFLSIVPTAAELSNPFCSESSCIHPSNLPKTFEPFTDFRQYISAHLKLLRADTFSSVTNILAAGCYQLPGMTYDEKVLTDVSCARIYDSVEYLGRAVWKGWESSAAYIFRIRPKKEVSWTHVLPRAQFVCFTTGLDRSKIEEGEIFWGMIGDVDDALRFQGIFPVAPCNGNFDELVKKLERNAQMNQLQNSLMLETQVFYNGYEPVMGAMQEFLRPRGPVFPLFNSIVSSTKGKKANSNSAAEKDTSNAGSSAHYVPAHSRSMFTDIIGSIRSDLVLDAGQDSTLTAMPKKDLLLVQGPPGTGKSFIGCRVVESFVKFSQAMASGDILSELDPSSLGGVDPESLVTRLGPVVVITYKNHALDEFLLDLKRSGLWCQGKRAKVGESCSCSGDFTKCCSTCCSHTAKLVRIGGGSQEAQLAPYNLNQLVSAQGYCKEFAQARARVATLSRRIERICAEVTQLERGNVSEAHMKLWTTEEQRSSFQFKTDFESWLSGAKYIGKEESRKPLPLKQRLQSLLNQALEVPPPAKTTTLLQPAELEAESDDEADASVFAAMKKEFTRERDHPDDNCRPTLFSKESLRLAAQPPTPPADIPTTLQSLWSLSPFNRTEYLVFLIHRHIAQRAAEYLQACAALETSLVLLNHARDQSRLQALAQADVIGLTTTGCAMNQNLLRSVKPRLLVVEEAAEILESQLIACLTPSLQQLVLIGDHYQLQPKVETMELANTNGLSVSMFERLARMQPASVAQLVEQRRMKPGLSRLIRPFYDKQRLEDHKVVFTRPFIDEDGNKHYGDHGPCPGLVKECFMWTHAQPEELASFGRSKINTLEVKMVEQLVRHLIRERVRPSSITVITPYLGQKREIQNRLRRIRETVDVRVSTVDRFQGDENDVIVLSLVRTANLTAFLRLRNRMIVSCSRARFALTIIGNDSLLEQSPHWQKMLGMLRAVDCVGSDIPIRVGDQDYKISSASVEQGQPWPSRKKQKQDA
jgi:hypothetical protein